MACPGALVPDRALRRSRCGDAVGDRDLRDGGGGSPLGGWPRALGAVVVVFGLQLVLFQLPEEIGWTGFLQDRWQDRYSPLKLCAMVAFPWAVWHLPDYFVDEGVGIEQLVTAPVFLVFEFISLFFARVLIVWLYAMTGRSVLLVAIFHKKKKGPRHPAVGDRPEDVQKTESSELPARLA